jgi:alpha/beta superfamily hydrolase
VMCQQWQQQVYTGPKLSHDLHPTLNCMQSLIPKNLTKTAKNETSHFYNGKLCMLYHVVHFNKCSKFHASQTLVYAIPRCSFE